MKLRIIIDKPRPAAFNMAADLYLLSLCTPASEIVYLRFYSWDVPTITLGYTQKPEESLDKKALGKDGVSWIRRPTGGRAVLHNQDITYSCVFAKSVSEMGSDIAETYHLISQCLINGLKQSGINCTPHSFVIDAHEIKREIKLPCFLAPNRSEIMVKGRKLIGSAQKRAAEAVLQHGSIPLTEKFRELPVYQKISEEQLLLFIRLLNQKCTCVEECLLEYKKEILVDNLQQGFINLLPFTIDKKSWTEKEKQGIFQLAESEEFRNNWLV